MSILDMNITHYSDASAQATLPSDFKFVTSNPSKPTVNETALVAYARWRQSWLWLWAETQQTLKLVHLLFLFVFPHSLKYLNVSANALESIPPSSLSEESLSTLQELYLTGNSLNENCGALLVGHQNLRVLHIAYNQLLSFPARCVYLVTDILTPLL